MPEALRAPLLVAWLLCAACASADGLAPGAERDMVAALRSGGADLSRPVPVEHALVLPSRAKAEEACREAAALGYEVEPVRVAFTGDGWMCIARRSRRVTEDGLTEARSQLEPVAGRLGGRCDGLDVRAPLAPGGPP